MSSLIRGAVLPLLASTSLLVACGGGGSTTPTPTPQPSSVQHALQVVVAGPGTVTSMPAGIDCGSTCSMTRDAGAVVTLTALAASNAAFSGWSGACAGSAATCSVTLSSAASVTANFQLQHQLTVSITGSGSVTSTPAGISCSANCNARYADGASVALAANPGAGYVFDGWSGACSGAADTCTLTLSGARDVTARFVTAPVTARTCTQVTQSGVTFVLDGAYPCGNFANGDYWVTPTAGGATVKITSITPAFTGAKHGWEVNPSSVTRQGFDEKAADFDPSLVPSLPYAARAGQSIVKTISYRDADDSTDAERTFVDVAVVLTVLGAVPTDNGASVLRPPYFGTDKPLYSTKNLRLDKLPRLQPVAHTPTLAAIAARYQPLQLDHQMFWSGHMIHPVKSMPFYGADIAMDNTVAALRFMLDDQPQAKQQAVINYIQYGIDLAAARRGGLHFEADGGHRHGRKLVLSLTALLLGDAGMAALVHDAPADTYQEDGQLYYSAVASTVLFGKSCAAGEYWYNQHTQQGNRTCRDPYGYIDGGEEPGGGYQFCCTARAYKAIALALRLLPELQCTWNSTDILVYADRWVNHGAWAQPDPYAPLGDGALDSNPGDGIGRFPQHHGRGKNDGYYDNLFADAMWSAHRAGAPAAPDCGSL